MTPSNNQPPPLDPPYVGIPPALPRSTAAPAKPPISLKFLKISGLLLAALILIINAAGAILSGATKNIDANIPLSERALEKMYETDKVLSGFNTFFWIVILMLLCAATISLWKKGNLARTLNNIYGVGGLVCVTIIVIIYGISIPIFDNLLNSAVENEPFGYLVESVARGGGKTSIDQLREFVYGFTAFSVGVTLLFGLHPLLTLAIVNRKRVVEHLQAK